jgi:hypothetical protein
LKAGAITYLYNHHATTRLSRGLAPVHLSC